MIGLTRGLVAALALLLLPAVAHAGPLSGEWIGSYVCAQGETALTLSIEDAGRDAPRGDIVADFRFSALPHNPAVPSGSFSMRGRIDAGSGRIELYGERWRQRPFLYEMVNLFGGYARTIDGDVISGEVGFPAAPGACTVFRVVRPPPRIS
ncbi:MAG: hypothetical protein JNJ73_09835 [Hyphomonadaceae bacterium]|nr:hypothetical protein [Hyphomonadaceae bacterium]